MRARTGISQSTPKAILSSRGCAFPFTYGFREWGRQIAGFVNWQALIQDYRDVFSIDAVYLSLDRRVARRLSDGLTIKAVLRL